MALRALVGPLEISSNFRIYELAGESWVTRLGLWGIGCSIYGDAGILRA